MTDHPGHLQQCTGSTYATQIVIMDEVYRKLRKRRKKKQEQKPKESIASNAQ